jgi:outer membrane protein
MTKTITTITFILIGIMSLSAQKFGYVNSAELIRNLPEVQAADSQLEAYQKVLFSKGEEMVKTFEAEYTSYMTKVNEGTLSQVEMQEEEARLTTQQQNIQKYEVEVQENLAAKKQELYQPILDKVQVIVDQVGKEMGYTMIFDTSMGGIVFVEESDNLLTTIQSRL